MAIGDILHATFVQKDQVTGEKILTGFDYEIVDAGGNAEGLYTALSDTGGILDSIVALQEDRIDNVSVRVVNLFSLVDFFETGFGGQGAISGGSMLPLYTAINFALKLDTRGVRPGSKRISGLDETANQNGIVADSGTITNINTLASLLDDTLELDATPTFRPVVVKRVKYVVDDGLPTEHFAYRYPETLLELEFGHIVSALANLTLSHQVSRGNGR